MQEEILYMLGVVAVGFVVNYTLRALPFLIFAGRDRELPGWVRRFGDFISPVIIAGLIVYSYSGLAWRSPWPYLAGLLTVGLQLWKKNALVSIVVGTVLYMFLLTGCSTVPSVTVDARDPSIRVSAHDGIFVGETVVPAADVPEILADAEIPRERTIHIRVDRDVQDLKAAHGLIVELRKAGYSGAVLVTERHAESFVSAKKKAWQKTKGQSGKIRPRKIRYKGANE